MSALAGLGRAERRQVVALGWVSLLTDAASDMIHPLLPALLRGMGQGAPAVGLVEGVAEAVAAVAKVTVGRASDRTGRRKPFVVAGYALATVARPLLALASAPWHAALVRGVDRVGKGMRGPARDALLAEAAPAGARAAAFGFHRMMDNLGAAVGALAATFLMAVVGLGLRTIFWLSLVPGVLAVVVAAGVVRERRVEAVARAAAEGAAPLPTGARRFLAVSALFALAASSDAFLLQRLLDFGVAEALLPIAWVALQLGKSALNVVGGRLADRVGVRRALVGSWLVYALAYLGFALARSPLAFVGAMAAYTVHYGLGEGAAKATLAGLVPPPSRGRAFGAEQAIAGAFVLPANLGFGAVYAAWGPPAAFGATAGIALVAAILLARARLAPAPVA